jgi:hypothetical protein
MSTRIARIECWPVTLPLVLTLEFMRQAARAR